MKRRYIIDRRGWSWLELERDRWWRLGFGLGIERHTAAMLLQVFHGFRHHCRLSLWHTQSIRASYAIKRAGYLTELV